MLGLIDRAIEEFARETYGDPFWRDFVRRAGLGVGHFEAMMSYDPRLTRQLVDGLAEALDKPPEEVLEDVGTYLVSAAGGGAMRRLLRFSGTDFVDFLRALDDLPARARLALPELDMPGIFLREHTPRAFSVTITSPGAAPLRFGHVVMGLLRAMADDYGALVYLDYKGESGHEEIIEITLLDAEFAEARAFDLGAPA